MSILFAVDPPGCGCTHCLTDKSVPLDVASADHIFGLLAGSLADRTSTTLILSVDYELSSAGGLTRAMNTRLTASSARVRAGNRTWTMPTHIVDLLLNGPFPRS